MGSLSSRHKNDKYLLCVVDVFTKYAWIKPLKDKKAKTVLNAFVETVNESNHNTNKLLFVWSRKTILSKNYARMVEINDIFLYSTHNKDKSVLTERFTKPLKS